MIRFRSFGPVACRPLAATCLLLAWAGMASGLGAAEVEIRLAPLGGEEIASLSPAVIPRELLDDRSPAAAFDEVSRQWVISVRPLESYLTELSLHLEKPDSSRFPRPPLHLALPYRDGVFEVVMPLSAEPDGMRAWSAYRGDVPAEDSRDYLIDFLQASVLIDFLIQDAAADTVEPTPALARALVVYAESVERLLSETGWFGVPVDVHDHAEMIKRVLAAAATDDDLAGQINTGRVANALDLVKGAEHRLYARIWRALEEVPSLHCNESFPVLRSFYSHLQQLSRERYVRIRDANSFTRTQVLLQGTSCFRRLLTIDPGSRYAVPQVIAGAFGGRLPSEVAMELRQNLERELTLVRLESGGVEAARRSCDAREEAGANERKICEALAYLAELEPMLIEENLHATN